MQWKRFAVIVSMLVACLASVPGAAQEGASATQEATSAARQGAGATQEATPAGAARGADGSRVNTAGRAQAVLYNEDDLAFLQHMIVHHEQALVMSALVPSRTGRAALMRFARQVERAQAAEIELMQSLLSLAAGRGIDLPGHALHGDPPMAGMLSTAQMDALAAASGAQFERLWLEGMIFHHEGAITMAEAQQRQQLVNRRRPYGLDVLVEDILVEQRAEIGQMQLWLDEWELTQLTTAAAAESGATGHELAPTPRANALTDAERNAGWRLLFDGESLDNWRGYNRPDLPQGWAVEEGAVVRVGSGGDIITREQFADFELEFEWKVGPGGNSGVFYRAREGEEFIYHSAPEMQLLDDVGHADGGDPLTSAGANYGLHPAPRGVVRPAGEWNQARVVVDGARVEHWLNGVQVVEYALGSEDWTARVAQSKFADWPAYGRARQGHIGLQDHGDPVWFRNMKVRVLARP